MQTLLWLTSLQPAQILLGIVVLLGLLWSVWDIVKWPAKKVKQFYDWLPSDKWYQRWTKRVVAAVIIWPVGPTIAVAELYRNNPEEAKALLELALNYIQ